MCRLLLISLCLAAVNVEAQDPHPCKSPPLMVGRLSVMNPKGDLNIFERFSYDALERRIRVRAGGHVQNHTFFEDLLLLYNEGVSFEISFRNQTCKKSPLKAPFQPIAIPPDAQLQAEVILGSSSGPGMGLLVNSWTGAVPQPKGKYFLTFTEFGCLPVSVLYHTDETGWVLSSFFDLMIGIEDPEEFIPPPFCDKAELEEMESERANDFLKSFI